jgi:hypothetical protein
MPRHSSRSQPGRAPLALALGGGGAFGIGFHLGVLQALHDAGLPVRQAPKLGISAGTWAAAALVTDTPAARLAEAWAWGRSTTPAGKLVRTGSLTERAFGDAHDATVSGVALALPLHRLVVVTGEREPLADVVAASSSPFGAAVGHRLRGRRLYDAGLGANTAAYLAEPADVTLVVAPLATGVLGWQGASVWERRLQRELKRRRAGCSGSLLVLRPSATAVRAGGATWRQVMDMRHVADVQEVAYRDARAFAAEAADLLSAGRGQGQVD